MNTLGKVCAGLLMAGGVAGLAGCTKLKARNELNDGVRAFKAAQFNQAEEDFKRAIQLDPTFTNAKLYLATAYQSQFVPNGTSPDNVHVGEEAVRVYKEVLDQNPNNVNAVAGIAKMYFDMKKLDEARQYYQKELQLDPNNPIPYYSIGVIDWTQTFGPNTQLRAQLGVQDQRDPLIGKKPTKKAIQACEGLAKTSLPLIDEGLKNLQQAMQLRANYADAMTYVNLLYRQKADMECNDAAARTADLAEADNWVTKSLSARKEEAAAAAKAAEKGGVHPTESQ